MACSAALDGEERPDLAGEGVVVRAGHGKSEWLDAMMINLAARADGRFGVAELRYDRVTGQYRDALGVV